MRDPDEVQAVSSVEAVDRQRNIFALRRRAANLSRLSRLLPSFYELDTQRCS